MKIGGTTQLKRLKHTINIVWRGILYLILILLVLNSKSFSQNVKNAKRYSLEFKDADLRTIITILEDRTGNSFIFSDERIIPEQKFSFVFHDETLKDILARIFYPIGLDYVIANKYIVLKKRTTNSFPATKLLINIAGRIVDEKNRPLPGVSVYTILGNKGVSTDPDGKFKICAQVGDTLIVSAIGYNTMRGVVGKDCMDNISLDMDVVKLDEVVVVGYGSQDKRDVLGAVSSIRSNKVLIENTSVNDVLNGRVAGLFGGGSTDIMRDAGYINIRGISSLNPAVNNPLIVIDGIPMFGINSIINSYDYVKINPVIDFSANTKVDYMFMGGVFEKNPLNDINVQDIESIEVLKDSYATAIFGSRGATGVILIQTKKGKGEPALEVSTSVSASEAVRLPHLLTGDEYSDLYSEYYRLKALANGKDELKDYSLKGVNTSWLDEITRTAFGKDFAVSYGGTHDRTSFYTGFSYADKQSYIKGGNYKYYTFRFNAKTKYSDLFTVGNNFGIYYGKNTSVTDKSIYRSSLFKAPNESVKDSCGDYIYINQNNSEQGDRMNPVAKIEKDDAYLRDFRLTGNVYLDFNITSALKYRAEAGVDYYKGKFYNRVHDNPANVGGEAIEADVKNAKYVINNTVSYNSRFGLWDMDFIGGQSIESAEEGITTISGKGFAGDSEKSIESAVKRKILDSKSYKWALFSLFSRLNVQYGNRYMLGVTYRLDGSSRFNKKQRYVGFPSFSLGWRVSEMDFMEGINSITNLKIRASLGYSGIDGSGGYYGNRGLYAREENSLMYGGTDILVLEKPSNPNLKWEITRTVNVGTDIEFWGGDCSLSIDYYDKRISNLLYESSLPAYRGFTSQLQNIGDMRNRGLEIEINSNYSFGELGCSSYLNASYNHNKVERLNFTGEDYWDITNGLKYFIEGESAGVFWVYDWAGVDKDTGNSLWRYADGSISEVPPYELDDNKNKYIAGSPLPKIWGGIGTVITYKNWNMSCHFSYAWGNKLFNATRAILTTYTSGDGNNLSVDIKDYWRKDNRNTDIPALINRANEDLNYNSAYTSDRFLEDASYLRLENLLLAYKFDISGVAEHLGVKKLQVYAQINNLFTWTKYSGNDPTVSYFGSSSLLAGYDELCLPSMRTYKLGLKIGF